MKKDLQIIGNGFSARLEQALDLRNFPPLGKGRIAALQEIFNLSRAGANKWIHNKAFPHKKKRREIAEKLGINLHWLETGNGDPLEQTASQYEIDYLVKKIPKLRMDQIYLLHETLEQKNHETMLISTDLAMKAAFAAVFVGDSMFPKFYDGNLLLIELNQAPKDGDFVIAKTNLFSEAILRQYVVGSSHHYLVAINSKFDPIVCDKNIEIVGRVIEVRLAF